MPRRSLVPAGILDDLQVRVGRLGEQVGEDLVALDLGHAEQLRAPASVQLVEHRCEVGPLGRVRLLGPALAGVNSKSREIGSSTVSKRFSRFHQATRSDGMTAFSKVARRHGGHP